MNSFKIALKNIKKSRSDYSVYFFTLIIGVAIFYMFNSIGTQGLMEDVSKSGNENVQMLISVMGGVSVGVAVILGMLIIYANGFLIKRRKKEFGIYMLLGMGKKKVSKILISETCVVGFVSLVIGMIAGIFGSQLLSIVVAKMFAVDVTGYTFDISGRAVVITILCFAAIFLVVLIFNTKMVGRYKLIDLMNAEKAREKQIIRNTKLSVVLFILSFAVLTAACIEVGFFGEDMSKNGFIACSLILIVATFVIFASFAGFFQKLMEKRGGFYKKRLNSYIVRQFSGNMNTSAVSMALISLLLFISLCLFSSGFSIRTYLNNRLGNATPVDVTMQISSADPEGFLKEKGVPLNEWAGDYLQIPVYEGDSITISDTVAPVMDKAKETFMYADWTAHENVIKLSDYNRIEKMYGRDELVLGDDQYAMVSDFDLLNTLINPSMEQGNVLTPGDYQLSPAYKEVCYEFILMSGMSADMGAVIVPDAVVDSESSGLECSSTLVIADYNAETEEGKADIDAKLKAALGEISDRASNGELEEGETGVRLSTKTEIKEASVGTSVITVFLVLYIGIVFVVACAAIIALKVMSDSLDSVQKFRILSRIGAGENMRKKALFVQILMNYLIPLVMAAFTAFFGLRYIKGLISAIGTVNMTSGILFTFIIMVIVYGGYFLTTYEGCKKLVKG